MVTDSALTSNRPGYTVTGLQNRQKARSKELN